MKLEDLQPTASVRGILPDSTVSVVSVEWHGSDALTLVFRTADGRVAVLPRGGTTDAGIFS